MPINPFGLNRWDPAARDYVLGTLHEWYKMNEYVVAGNVQGEIFELPAERWGSRPASRLGATTAR